MLDTTGGRADAIEVFPGRKIAGRVAGLYVAEFDHFVTREADSLDFGLEGIAGDHHSGATRKSSSREPWYPRNTEIRNERQLSIVAPDELALIAGAMDLAEVRPEWIGANLSIDGVPSLSMAIRYLPFTTKPGVLSTP